MGQGTGGECANENVSHSLILKVATASIFTASHDRDPAVLLVGDLQLSVHDD